MNILVTGGMGEVGRPVVNWLLGRGHDIRVLDLDVSRPIDGAECIQGTITDFEALAPVMAGMDAVVHLAAYRHPSLAPEARLFHVNTVGTFHVFRAAADAGIKRVACASSINALGYNFGITFPKGQLRYFPIDEDHPEFTTDPYSFSKQMIERIGTYFWHREGITSTFLRFPAVYDLTPDEPGILMAFVEGCYKHTSEVMALPEQERSSRIQDIVDDFERRAHEREWEAQFDLSFPDADIMFGRSNFWTSLDARDAAQAIEKSLLADIEGSHAMYVTDAHNFAGIPSRDLVATWFPEVTEWRSDVRGTETLVSIDRARALIGFEPAFPFRGRDKG